MNINDLKIYVTTSNEYVHVLKVFSHLFNKFWGHHQKVIVAGFDKIPDFELPENFNFVSLGKQVTPFVDFCADMRKLLDIIEDEYFISLEENEFIIRPVNFKILNSFQPYLNKDLGRVDFTRGVSTRPNTIIKREKDYDIISSNIEANYRIAMRAGIWNKSYLLNHCRHPLNTHEFEHVATERSRYDGHNIISSSRAWAVTNMDGIKHTMGPYVTNLRSLPPTRSRGIPVDEETIQELVELNFVQALDNGLFRIVE